MPRTALTRTMAPFNNGKPLAVVCMEDGRMGVVDEAAGYGRVWIEYDMHSSRVHNVHQLKMVQFPLMPERYGEWLHKSIGGVSETMRRIQLLRANPKTKGPICIFAIGVPSSTAVSDALSQHKSLFTVGDSEFTQDDGYVTEVISHSAENVAHAAAMIARIGGVPMLEDASVDAGRGIGVERLDRIGARVLSDETMIDEKDDLYGLRRGCENWHFPWLPDGWQVPITWDHMVNNVIHHDIDTIPQPLRQHVAKVRLERGDYPPIGSRWEVVPDKDVPNDEVICWNEEHDTSEPLPFHIFYRVITLPVDEQAKVARREDVGVESSLNSLTLIEGVWYRPCNTRRFLEKHILKSLPWQGMRRWTTPHLEMKQSKQLIEAFYLLTVEQLSDPIASKGLKLIMFTYMKERGYTARWLGKYKQDASHIGNGGKFRKFRRLHQYDPHRLPVDVLNRLCGTDGVLRNRGSKGTRSKYKQTARPAYIPRRRLKRTKEDERLMHSR